MSRLSAGCGRVYVGLEGFSELAYTALEFPECPNCPHRIEPQDAPPFCRWLDEAAPHPFAALADLKERLA